MYILDKAKAKEILLNEFGRKEYEVDTLLARFPEIHDELGKAVEKWLIDRTVEDLNVFGITIKEAMEVNKDNFLVTVQMLNKLYDEDMDDQKREDWIRILRKPHTFE